MPFEQRSLDDYIDVAQRIADFREKYPEGTLTQAEPWRVVQVDAQWCRQCIGRRQIKPKSGDWRTCPRCNGSGVREQGEPVLDTFIVYIAAAYRTPDDLRPGIGAAWEPYPGQTPYTLGSELMNAETSAWGRAIIAVGASDSKPGIASREEVRNRQAERDDGLPTNADGSLSRSQTSAVPGMASQRTGGVAGMEAGSESPVAPHLVDAAVDDRWTTDAPSWLVGVDPPEDQPGSILPAQRSQIMAVYTALGIKAREARLLDMQNVLATGDGSTNAITSTNDLSHQQAARLLEDLHERHTGKMTRR